MKNIILPPLYIQLGLLKIIAQDLPTEDDSFKLLILSFLSLASQLTPAPPKKTKPVFLMVHRFDKLSKINISLGEWHNTKIMLGYHFKKSWTIVLMSRVFVNDPGDRCSIPGRIIPKTQKTVLDAALLSSQLYKVRIESKLEQSCQWCSGLPGIMVLLLWKRDPSGHPRLKLPT